MRFFLLFLVLATPLCARADEKLADFRPLLDGQSVAGWVAKTEDGKPTENESWSVVDGVLTCKAGQGWLSSKEMYGDFVLRLEWRVPENGNSGIFLRVPEMKAGERPHLAGIEIQVLDDQGPIYAGKLKPWQFSGSIYGAVAAENSSYKGPGQWNAYHITCRGERIEVLMNGRLVSAADVTKVPELKDRPRRGYIGLQNHGSGVEYRRIEIQVLD
jgi:hypothetical protein